MAALHQDKHTLAHCCHAGAKLTGALLCVVAVWPFLSLARAAGPADCRTADGHEDHGATWVLFAFLAATTLGGALALVSWAADADNSCIAGLGLVAFGGMFSGLIGAINTSGCRHSARVLGILGIVVGSPMLLCVGLIGAAMALGLLGLVLHPFLKLAFPQAWPAFLSRLGVK